MFSIPPNVTDAGPDTRDPSDGMDCWDWLEVANHGTKEAMRASGNDGTRMEAIKRAQIALENAAMLAEHDILFRWQAIVGDCVIPAEVAPSKEHRADLARDMRALGWRLENGRYVRPEPPLMRGKP